MLEYYMKGIMSVMQWSYIETFKHLFNFISTEHCLERALLTKYMDSAEQHAYHQNLKIS